MLLELCEGFWAVPSLSEPGRGYMLEVGDGRVSCECRGFERFGVCYHAAALALQLDLIPARFLGTNHSSEREVDRPGRPARETALLQVAPKGLAALWA